MNDELNNPNHTYYDNNASTLLTSTNHLQPHRIEIQNQTLPIIKHLEIQMELHLKSLIMALLYDVLLASISKEAIFCIIPFFVWI